MVCYISRRWMLLIWTSVERRVLHISTTVTYLDDGGYISGRLLHIWMVTYLYARRLRLSMMTEIEYDDDQTCIYRNVSKYYRVSNIWSCCSVSMFQSVFWYREVDCPWYAVFTHACANILAIRLCLCSPICAVQCIRTISFDVSHL